MSHESALSELDPKSLISRYEDPCVLRQSCGVGLKACRQAGYDVVFTGSLINGTPPDFDVNHEGHGSYRADQIRDTIYDWLDTHNADVVLLHIGTNDIAGGNQDVAEVAAILDEIDRWKADHARNLPSSWRA